MANGVLILAEVADGDVVAITNELIGAAQRLGAGPVSAMLIGSGVEAAASKITGVEKTYVVDDASLAQYTTDGFTAAVAAVAQQADPAIILLGQTDIGRDLGPALASKLGTAVAMDTIAMEMKDGKLHTTRPAYGGNARAVNSFSTEPAIATVRPKSQDAVEGGAAGAVEKVSADLSAVRTKVVDRQEASAEGVRLEDAAVVVSGGRGLGGPEGFEGIEELAKLLNGAVGCSRAVADLGWRPVAEQVGLTGKVVSPTIYIAVAISGASQHMAGCSGSKNIIAINKDADANIFKASRFGIVGDYKQVLPALIDAVKKVKAEG
ncbi:MAG TPA: electron transfer flavoprotein subunit alpha/FixB family protein [Dehalococcoidia bacterium]|jgi:electron transfer flavoprotein alpha subunit|nr:electron transfer flavoprotein subunit alpha/FixB family protein [Dehalococcoidia bacterium]